jgi:hypothetical protein
MNILRCPLVPDKDPKFRKCTYLIDGETYWYVCVGGVHFSEWIITGPGRKTKEEAIAVWNEAWGPK